MPIDDVFWRSTLRFSGPRLTEIREEAGFSRQDLASRLGVPWNLVAIWENRRESSTSCPAPFSEPTVSQAMDLARILNTHPVDLFRSGDDEDASEADQAHGSKEAFGRVLHGPRLRALRLGRHLSVPMAAARARVSQDEIRRSEEGRGIGIGPLFRLLVAYVPGKAPGDLLRNLLLDPAQEEPEDG